jgi:ankyrin repeat protein
MVRHGFDVNKELVWQGGKPLDTVAKIGCPIVAFHLISAGAEVNGYNASGETPLYRASLHAQRVVAEILLKHGADAMLRNRAAQGRYELALHAAASTEMAELLLIAGTPVNATSCNESSYTALHWAVSCVKPDMVQILLKYGAMDSRNSSGDTALDIAKKIKSKSYQPIMLNKENCQDDLMQVLIQKIIRLLEPAFVNFSQGY